MLRVINWWRWGRTQINSLTMPQAILIIVLLSFAVKIAYILLLGGGLDSYPREGSDVQYYDLTARNLLQSGIYGRQLGQPETVMPPGQTVFLAVLYVISNYSMAFAKLAHVSLLTLVAVLTFLTGKALVGRALGFGAGLLLAIDPAYAYLSGTFLSEALFIFLMALGIYMIARWRTSRNVWLLIATGLCFGLAGLTRNQGWLFALTFWLGSLITSGRLVSIRAATLVLLVTATLIAPWTYRNYLVSAHFIPVASEGGLNLWSSNNPEFVWRQPMPMSLPIYQTPSGLSEAEIDQYYRQRAFDWIVAHPQEFIANGIRKVIALYNFDPLSNRPEISDLFRLAGLIPYGFLLPFIALGLLSNLGMPKLWPIYWYILFNTLLTVLFFGDSRIRAPIQPYLYLSGVLGVQQCAQWWRARRLQTLLTRHRTARVED